MARAVAEAEMILGTANMEGMTRAVSLDGQYKGAACMLVGGAPTIKDMPLHLLQNRGVVSAAINNSAKHFRPDLWFSGDNPACYDEIILRDPRILKFAPSWHMETAVLGGPMKNLPNMFFYVAAHGMPVADLLDDHRHTPWFGNTLLVAIHILYRLGFRRIILCGCDFEPDGRKMYAHDAPLNEKEWNANIRLYDSQVTTLLSLKPVFAEAGLELMDCSARSKMAGTYPVMEFMEAVRLLEGQAAPGGRLEHGTKFAHDSLRKMAGVWEPPPQQSI